MDKKTEEGCIFCKIVNGELPSWTVYEDEDFKAFLDIEPASKGHVVLIPKNHSANLYELPEEDASRILLVAKKVGAALQRALPCDGLNVLQNNGEYAGQTVFHYHIHLIPRYKGDGVRLEWAKGAMEGLDAVHGQIIAEI